MVVGVVDHGPRLRLPVVGGLTGQVLAGDRVSGTITGHGQEEAGQDDFGLTADHRGLGIDRDPDVNRLLKQYQQMESMMSKLSRGGMKGMMRGMKGMMGGGFPGGFGPR